MEGPQEIDINGIKSRIDTIQKTLDNLEVRSPETNNPALEKSVAVQKDALREELVELRDQLTKF